jgi:hypothetical protein
MMAFRLSLILCLVMLGCAIAAWLQGGSGNGFAVILCGGIGLALFAPYLLDWYFLTIDNDRIVLKSLWRRREIPYTAIGSIEIQTLVTEGGGARNVQMYLRITMVGGQALCLKSFRNQTLNIQRLMEGAPGFGRSGSSRAGHYT